MDMENELSLRDYLSIVERRWPQILAIFLLAMVVITIVAFTLPSVYRSAGIISVESSSIPENIVKQAAVANYVGERIDKVKQSVLSKENLQRINSKYQLFPGLDKPKDIVKATKKLITFDTETRNKSSSQWSSEKVTVALIVGFEYSDPDVTHKVANELVTMFLDENVKARTKRVAETTDFLTEELSKLKGELEKVEDNVATYKQAHASSLPEHMELHMGTLDRTNLDVKDLDRDYKNTEEELRYLEVELATTTAAFKSGGSGEIGGISELGKARAELERSLILYKETHPTIRALKRKVALLEKADQMPEDAKPVETNVAAELALAKIQTKIQSARARLGSIANQKKSMRAKMARLQSQIVKIPQVERKLFTLLRDYENAKAKYEDVKAKQINAKIAENLESGDRAERLSLLERPEFPEYRLSPVRKKIIGLGLFGALGLGLVFAGFLEFLDKRVRGQGALSAVINMRPLAVIPYISTQDELKHKKNLMKRAYFAGVVLAGLLLLAAIVYFFVV